MGSSNIHVLLHFKSVFENRGVLLTFKRKIKPRLSPFRELLLDPPFTNVSK